MQGTGTDSWLGGASSVHANVVERGEQPDVILANIQKHIPSWAEAVNDLTD